MKKLLSVILALLMVVSLCVTAFASDDTKHTITINNDKSGHVYAAYRIFKGDLNMVKDPNNEEEEIHGTVLSDITWGEGVDIAEGKEAKLYEALAAIVDDEDNINPFTKKVDGKEEPGNLQYASEVAKVLSGYGDDSAILDTFARVISGYFSDNSYASKEPVLDGNVYQYAIEVPGDGYYLVMDSKSYDAPEASTKFMLKVAKDETITAKDGTLTQDKAIVKGNDLVDVDDYDVGDTVDFQILSDITNMDGYLRYEYVICATMSKGLTPVLENDNVKVTVSIVDPTGTKDTLSLSNNDYQFLSTAGSGYTFKLRINNFLKYKEYEGCQVKVTYSGILNEQALETKFETNESFVIFSNDPNKTFDPNNPSTANNPYKPDGSDEPYDPNGANDPTVISDESTVATPKAVVYVVDFDINLDKYAMEGDKNIKLANAKFVLYKLDDNKPVFYKLTNTKAKNDGDVAWVSVAGYAHAAEKNIANEAVLAAVANGTITEVTTDEGGTAKFAGLDTGTYYLLETDAPDGYNTLATTVEVKIAATYEVKDDGTLTIIDNESSVDLILPDAKQPNVVQPILNKAGVVLPSTGGIGTTIFYVLGTVMMIGAAVILITKRRVGAE